MSIKDRINSISKNDNLDMNTKPVMAKIELTGCCTLNCSFCAHKKMKEMNIRQKMLTEEKFNIILNEIKLIKTIKEIGLFYMGESGLNPLLPLFAQKAQENGFFTFLTTNGTVLENVLKSIPYIDSLKISWNYKDEIDFINKTLMPKEYYYTIISNIDKIYNECHKFNKTLAISTVLDTKQDDYKNVLKLLKYDEHYFIPLQNQGGNNDKGATGVLGQYDNMVSPIPCWSLFKGVYIDVDLNVRICCYGHTNEHIIGNLLDHNLGNLLSDDKITYCKQAHLDKKIPDVCRKCLNI